MSLEVILFVSYRRKVYPQTQRTLERLLKRTEESLKHSSKLLFERLAARDLGMVQVVNRRRFLVGLKDEVIQFNLKNNKFADYADLSKIQRSRSLLICNALKYKFDLDLLFSPGQYVIVIFKRVYRGKLPVLLANNKPLAQAGLNLKDQALLVGSSLYLKSMEKKLVQFDLRVLLDHLRRGRNINSLAPTSVFGQKILNGKFTIGSTRTKHYLCTQTITTSENRTVTNIVIRKKSATDLEFGPPTTLVSFNSDSYSNPLLKLVNYRKKELRLIYTSRETAARPEDRKTQLGMLQVFGKKQSAGLDLKLDSDSAISSMKYLHSCEADLIVGIYSLGSFFVVVAFNNSLHLLSHTTTENYTAATSYDAFLYNKKLHLLIASTACIHLHLVGPLKL